MVSIVVISYFSWRLIGGLFFMFIIVLAGVLAGRYVFSSASLSMQHLMDQMRSLDTAGLRSGMSPSNLLVRQLTLMRRVRVILLLYLTFLCAVCDQYSTFLTTCTSISPFLPLIVRVMAGPLSGTIVAISGFLDGAMDGIPAHAGQ